MVTGITCERIIKDEYKLVKEFNKYYINNTEKSGQTEPVKLGVFENWNGNEEMVNDISKSYKGYSSILSIKDIVTIFKLHKVKF